MPVENKFEVKNARGPFGVPDGPSKAGMTDASLMDSSFGPRHLVGIMEYENDKVDVPVRTTSPCLWWSDWM